MKIFQLTDEEQKQLNLIENTYYMRPILALFDEFISNYKPKVEAYIKAFDKIYELLIKAKPAVDKLLEKRQKKGDLRDINQARKSIAGNAFSQLIVYLFLKNKQTGQIRADIFITNSKSKVQVFDKVATINVDGETQKPDCDLIIYTKTGNIESNKCIILSLKTSLRERAGQTYKWKLLMEIATTDNPIKDKYNITYNSEEMPFVCFVTANFYNEINNPQHRGMFKFFDKSFISKEIDSEFISRLSSIIPFVNENL
ncbi:MAG: hypothetical protein FJY65_02385 [Calditrichaeota bacterium]|nr:hypothetical protein [Calditrichota bacterium]